MSYFDGSLEMYSFGLTIFKEIFSEIWNQKWRDSPDAERELIRFLVKVKKGGIYGDKQQYWYNPNRILDNHYVAMYIGTLILKNDYEKVMERQGLFSRLYKMRNVKKFMKYQQIVLNINERINYEQEKIVFKLKCARDKEFIYLEEKTTSKTVLRFMDKVNRALKYHNRIFLQKL